MGRLIKCCDLTRKFVRLCERRKLNYVRQITKYGFRIYKLDKRKQVLIPTKCTYNVYISYNNTFRLDDLKKNLESWEGYENFRNKFDGQLQEAEGEFKSTVRIYNLEEGPKNHTGRLATASKMRKQLEETMAKYKGANDELAKMLPDDTKDEMQEEVRKFS